MVEFKNIFIKVCFVLLRLNRIGLKKSFEIGIKN